MDDATERHLLFEAAADPLRRAASSGSLTLILDDLRWAEPTALLLLRHLGRALADAPVLLIASYRATAPDLTPDLCSAIVDLARGRSRRLTLSGIDDGELGRLLRAVTAASLGLHCDPCGHTVLSLAAAQPPSTSGPSRPAKAWSSVAVSHMGRHSRGSDRRHPGAAISRPAKATWLDSARNRFAGARW